ncbi:HD domain-containing protein [Acidaminobacterium chupaoyuni]
MKNGLLIGEMIAYEAGCPQRIDHFLKVYGFAKAIGAREQLSSVTLNIVETAGITHDIGIRAALERFGECTPARQEELGAEAARALLERLGYSDRPFIERVCWLIAHHHSYENIRDIDLQILVEADFLVNLKEKNAPRQQIEQVRDAYFKTATGKLFLERYLLEE